LLRPIRRNCLAYPEGEYLYVDERSVHPVSEQGKRARTPLADFLNIPNRKDTSWQGFRFRSQFTPFHLLATESKAHTHHDHQWSKETLNQLSATNSTLILTTPYKVVELAE
jgi:hypothetical protein